MSTLSPQVRQLRDEDMAPSQLRRVLNDILADVYARLEKVSRRAQVDFSIDVPAVVGNAFPLVLSVPSGLSVSGVSLVWIRDETTPATAVQGAAVTASQRADGMLSVDYLSGLTASHRYTGRLEIIGADA